MHLMFKDSVNSFEAWGDEAFVTSMRSKFLEFIGELDAARVRRQNVASEQSKLAELDSIYGQLSILKYKSKKLEYELREPTNGKPDGG